MPRAAFEEIMAPLKQGDAEGVERDESGNLVPTKETASLLRFNYTIRKGSVSDRVFNLESLEEAPKPRKPSKAPVAVPPINHHHPDPPAPLPARRS